jgi:hypothetical protein
MGKWENFGSEKKRKGRRTGLTLKFLENHEEKLLDIYGPRALRSFRRRRVWSGAAHPQLLSSRAACPGPAPADVDAGRRSLPPTSSPSAGLHHPAP